MRVLVAGIDGYVGAILCPTLVERGFDVVGID
jgi:nucleoside-diphosphate-sugar epimerase